MPPRHELKKVGDDRETTAPAGSGSGIRSLSRALDIIEAVAESEAELSLSKISSQVGLHSSTAYRFLEALAERNYIRKNPLTGGFSLGLKTLEIVGKSQQQFDYLRETARPVLARLVQDTQETANLAVLDRNVVVCIDQVECSRSVRLVARVGTRIPLYCSGPGKVFLAFLPRTYAEGIIDSLDFRPLTKHTIRSADELRKELDRVRHQGYAVNDEELEIGVRSVGAPVFGLGNCIVAAISISSPCFRLDRDAMHGLGMMVRNACNDLSRELGGFEDQSSESLPDIPRGRAS